MRWITEKDNLKGKVVLVRAGLNVPLHHGGVVNDFRIRKALPTLQFLHERGARTIIISHIGREKNETLAPVARELQKYLPISFLTREEMDSHNMRDGDLVLLENLRQDPREIENDDSLAQELASYADIFVQDAFSVCHREHSSIVGIPKYLESFGGLLLKEEVEALSRAYSPEHPALFVLGGAKFSTKESLVKAFVHIYDSIFVGGALQNEILAAKKYEVGESLVEDKAVDSEILNSPVLQVVTDVVVDRKGNSVNTTINDVKKDDVIVDIGAETIQQLVQSISQYKTVVWNGPLGWYERGFCTATQTLARALAESDAHVIIGGGDTVAVIQQLDLEHSFDFVSTGGGSMLHFLLNQTLPGLAALEI